MKTTAFGVLLFFCAVTLAADDFYSYVSRAGLTPMQGKVKDIDLPTLDGASFKLSSWKGQWILVNFWATWCGPCRYEMPLLEKMSQRFKKLKVLGVAVDGKEKQAVRKFLKQNKISFKNVLDVSGQTSTDYQASSVPVVYLISPDWKVVGRLQGAQDWDAIEIQNALSQLLKMSKTPDELPKTGGEELEPPVVEFKEVPGKINAGEKFVIEVIVTWNGKSMDYRLRPPKLTLPEGVWQGDVGSESSSHSDGAALRYQFPLRINKAGKYTLGPVELTYGQKKLKVMGQSIDIVVIGRSFSWIYLLILLPLLAVGIYLWKFRKRKKQDVVSIDDLGNRIEQLQKRKLMFSPKEYQIELLKIYQTLDSREFDNINRRIEKILYAGELLSPEETNYFEKKLNKHLFVEDE